MHTISAADLLDSMEGQAHPPIHVPMVPVPTHVGIDWGKGDRSALTAVVPTPVIPPGKVLVDEAFVAKVRAAEDARRHGMLVEAVSLFREAAALLPAE